MRIANVLWEAEKETLKKTLYSICEEYESDPAYSIKHIYDETGMRLQGFCVKKDENGVRIISEAHYLGKNKSKALLMWRWAIKGAKEIRMAVLKSNERMIRFLERQGFEIMDCSGNHSIVLRRAENVR